MYTRFVSVNYLVYLSNSILLIIIYLTVTQSSLYAQSIGYQPQLNFGFNPYMSPVYGYGLGLPFGAYNFSPSRYPWMLNSLSGAAYTDHNGFMSKIHTKAFLKKLALGQYSLYPHHGYLKDKLNLLKHPEYATTPYGIEYGYGKHYGAAMVPNNPYKGAYVDYYEDAKGGLQKSKPYSSDLVGGYVQSPSEPIATTTTTFAKPHLKPILKAGALITTAALIGKKFMMDSPIKLNPSGMISSVTYP